MSTAVFYDLENISKFTAPKNFGEFKESFQMICDSELVDDVVLQRAYISTTHPAYIKYNRFLNSTGVEICAVDPNMNSKKANLVDFKMNVDCVAYALSNNIDTVVIATGDADFGFLCEELKAYGKKVVVASYGITTNKSIIMLSDDWVDFSGEYLLCDIHELMDARIHINEPVDYKDALCSVIEAMLNDNLIKRYMSMERFDLDMLRNFTERFCKAPELEDMSYYEFVSLIISGHKVFFLEKNGRLFLLPSDEAIPEPSLSLYELVTGTDYDFSAQRFKAWHTWFEENLESVNELVYYINFMVKNELLKLDGDKAELIPKRKCAAALLEHAAEAVSQLNIKPEEKELEKLRSRFYRNAVKNRPVEEPTDNPEPEKELFVQGTMTNFGRIVVYADDEAVVKVEFTDEYVKYNTNDITMQAMQELREYFKGIRSNFTVPVKFSGSEFQNQVWQALCEIPYGETRTYKDIAKAVGKPKSFRAVGTACNKNPLLFIVPCHRVINTSGDLSGYAAGIELKTALLKGESSPSDFKRFGKQYTFNVKNPSERVDYRTSEEISKLLDEELAKNKENDTENDDNRSIEEKVNAEGKAEQAEIITEPKDNDISQAENPDEAINPEHDLTEDNSAEHTEEVYSEDNQEEKNEADDTIEYSEAAQRNLEMKSGDKSNEVSELNGTTVFAQLELDFDFSDMPKAVEEGLSYGSRKPQNTEDTETDTEEIEQTADSEEHTEETKQISDSEEHTEEAEQISDSKKHTEEAEQTSDSKKHTEIQAQEAEQTANSKSEAAPEYCADADSLTTITAEPGNTLSQTNQEKSSYEKESETRKAKDSASAKEDPSSSARKRHLPYKRRNKKGSGDQLQRKYSAKKHTAKKAEESKSNS